jgi:hypothetical protein
MATQIYKILPDKPIAWRDVQHPAGPFYGWPVGEACTLRDVRGCGSREDIYIIVPRSDLRRMEGYARGSVLAQ